MLINTLHDLAILAALEANASMCAAAMTGPKHGQTYTPSLDQLEDIAHTAWASAKCLVDAMHPGIRKSIGQSEKFDPHGGNVGPGEQYRKSKEE